GLTSAAVNGTVTAPTLNVTATSINAATAEAVLVGAAVFSASVAKPIAKTSQQTDASLGSAANVQVGTLLGPHATSTNTAEAQDIHVNLGAFSGSAMLPEAEAGGTTRAFVSDGAQVSAAGLGVLAEASNTAAVTPITVSAGAVTGTFAEPKASTTHNVEAFIGPAGDSDPNVALTGNINVGGGAVTVDARTTKNEAKVEKIGIEVGAITVDYTRPKVTAAGSTRAHIGGHFNVTASDVTVTADAT